MPPPCTCPGNADMKRGSQQFCKDSQASQSWCKPDIQKTWKMASLCTTCPSCKPTFRCIRFIMHVHNLIYCHGLLPGAARPAPCSENVGFTARSWDICECMQSPFLLRLPWRKYGNHTQTSGFILVLYLSAGRERLLG